MSNTVKNASGIFAFGAAALMAVVATSIAGSASAEAKNCVVAQGQRLPPNQRLVCGTSTTYYGNTSGGPAPVLHVFEVHVCEWEDERGARKQ